MNYIVLEIQTDGNGTTSVLSTIYSDKDQAESKYHTILAYAAVGNLHIHSAAIIMADGTLYMHDSYRRDEVFNNQPEEPEQPEGE